MPLIKINTFVAGGLTGTLPNAVFPATLPAVSAANLTSIPAGNLTGSIATARLPQATDSGQGIVQIGTNLTVLSGTVSLTGGNVTDALSFTPENTANKGQASGYASLDGSGKIPSSQLPAIAITDTFVVASQVAMLALAAQIGDVAVRTDLSKSFILKDADATLLASWQELLAPASAVLSVNGQTGAVTLDAGDIGVGAITNMTATDAQAAFAELQGDVDALVSADTALDTRLDTAESDIIAIDGRIDSLEGATGLSDHLNDTTDAHDASAISFVSGTTGLGVDNVQAAIVALDSNVDALDTRLDTAETDITSLDTRLDTAESDITALDGRLDALEVSTGLSDHLTDASDAHDASAISFVSGTTGLGVDNVQAAIVALDGNIDALDTRLDAAEADILDKQDTLGFTPEDSANKGQANGYASLGGDGKIPTSQLGAIAITDTFVVASQVAMLALTAQTGDVAVRTDLNKSFILKGTDPTVLADWQELLTPTDAVLSVNGQTGIVSLGASNIGISAITGVTATTVQGAIAEHQGDLDSLDGRVDTLETDVTGLDTRLDTAESDIAALEGADTALDTRLDAIEAGDVKVKTQAFAQLWAAGNLESFEGMTVVDYYVNSGSAKTLGKIVISSDLSGSTGNIEVDILKKNTTGGSLTTLFTTVAKPTLTANGGLTWAVVTGAGLPDVVAIPDGSVLVLQILNAPADAENIKVELYEV